MERVYPVAPLEMPVNQPQEQQHLLPPAPPSYDQATAESLPKVTPAQTSGPTATSVTQPHTVVIMPGPTVGSYGPAPMDVQCPYCHNYARTRLRCRPNSRTHLIALLLCLFQLYCCVCLPYCINSCMNTNHYCGMCDHYLGTYVRN